MVNKAELLQKQAGGAHIHTANKAECYYHAWKNGTWCIKANEKKFNELDHCIDLALVGDWKPLQDLLKNLW